ncbi:MAG TPA: hypothetical protein VKR32_09265 [Puia sp.]|nr:hypothetical protein [Puia sp.]
MTPKIFLLLNLAVAFYNAGTIWAHEVDIFRSWKLIPDPDVFHNVQKVHWRKLPYWVFIPVGLSFIGSIILFWYHPVNVAGSDILVAIGVQLFSHILTAIFWGPAQAKLSKDNAGKDSLWLQSILRTHWVRTFLINAYALLLLLISIKALA